MSESTDGLPLDSLPSGELRAYHKAQAQSLLVIADHLARRVGVQDAVSLLHAVAHALSQTYEPPGADADRLRRLADILDDQPQTAGTA
jgi:hypothetical protein